MFLQVPLSFCACMYRQVCKCVQAERMSGKSLVRLFYYIPINEWLLSGWQEVAGMIQDNEPDCLFSRALCSHLPRYRVALKCYRSDLVPFCTGVNDYRRCEATEKQARCVRIRASDKTIFLCN